MHSLFQRSAKISLYFLAVSVSWAVDLNQDQSDPLTYSSIQQSLKTDPNVFVDSSPPELFEWTVFVRLVLTAPVSKETDTIYQWFHDGLPFGLPGQGNELILPQVTAASLGLYSVKMTHPNSGLSIVKDIMHIFSTNSSAGLAPKPDYNKDGYTDLLFQHDDGFLAFWSIKDHLKIQTGLFKPSIQINPGWNLIGGADYDSDDNPDLLFQHEETGKFQFWLMDGTSMRERVELSIGMEDEANWEFQGSADFNGDGNIDLALVHRSNTPAIAFLENLKSIRISLNAINQTDLPFQGIGDLWFDGIPEFILFKQDFNLNYWRSGQFQFAQVKDTFSINPVEWRIGASADYDRDGIVDFVFENKNDGSLVIYFMQWIHRREFKFLNPKTVGAGWHLVGPR